MTTPDRINVRIIHGSTVFHVHGDSAGDEGVWMAAQQVHGLYEAPVKTTWKQGAFQVGGWYKHTFYKWRDLTIGFHIRDTTSQYELNESAFRQIFDYQLDPWQDPPIPTTIEVETELSGTRSLDVLMYEEPTFDPDLDPIAQQFGNHIFKLRAGQPFWYEDDIVTTVSSTLTAYTDNIVAENPTDQIAFQKWVLTRGTFTLPDHSWIGTGGAGGPGDRALGGPDAGRFVSNIIVTDTNGGAVVDLDGMELMFRDANDTNILAQLAGQFFIYPIPPYTQPVNLSCGYIDAPAGGAMIQLVIPRRWSRPWGMEMTPWPP